MSPPLTGRERELKPGLQEGEFRNIARRGFGDPGNTYPHCMTWFKDSLFVGTTRHNLSLAYNMRLKKGEKFPKQKVFPVKPRRIYVAGDTDPRAQIWRYYPGENRWERVYVSPVVHEEEGEKPVFFGFRNMLPARLMKDPEPVLYILPWFTKPEFGPSIIRSEDGKDFQVLPMKIPGESKFTSFRPLVEFKGKLFTAASGSKESPSMAGVAVVLETSDPLGGEWVVVNEVNFGDPTNLGVFEMAVFNNHLYAATFNPRGFQLWKTDAEGKPPYRWVKVISEGAGRGGENEGVASMCVFQNSLYLGTGILNGGYDYVHDIGPAASELIRVYPDDTWELVVGEGRIVEGEVKLPVSGLPVGFGNPFNTYFWRLCVHEGWLYLGTFNGAIMLPYLDKEEWGERRKRRLEEKEEDLVREMGGCELWRSRDGINWFPVTRDGFGNPYNYGIRGMVSSPHGLFVGTANPFSPEVAVKRTGGWVYEENPKGGLEIWLGSRESSDSEGTENLTSPGFRRGDYLDAVLSEWYEGDDFRSLGYWKEETSSVREACENLIGEILSHIPEKKGRILEVGSAIGNLRCLLRSYPSREIKGIFWGREEFLRAKECFPELELQHCYSPPLREKEESFQVVINIETLSSHPLAMDWLREMIRLLKPGGYLILVEILSQNPHSPWKKKGRWRYEPVTTPEEFVRLISGYPLENIEIFDLTENCWTPFYRKFQNFLWGKLIHHELDMYTLGEVRDRLIGEYLPFSGYLLLTAEKKGKDKNEKR